MAVKQLKSGKWRVDFRDQNNKRLRVKFKTKAEAEDFYNQSKAQVRQGTYMRPSRDTIGEKADQWMTRRKAMGYRFKTLQNWQIHIDKYIKSELGETPIQRATIQSIEEASLVWAERTSGNTANCVLKTLTSIFSLAQRHGPLEQNGTNVAKQAERIKLTTEQDNDGEIQPEDVWNAEQLSKLVDATKPGTLDRILIWLGGFCGLRIGEILGFTWTAIDLKAARPKVRVCKNLVSCEKAAADFPGYGKTGRTLKDPKSKKSRRTIDAPRELVHDLRLWKLKCPPGEPRPEADLLAKQILMSTVEGKPVQTKAAQNMLDAAADRAGIPRRSLHRLRHTFASLLLNAGEAPLKVSRLLGHGDLTTTTRVYTHFIDEETTAVQDLASRVLSSLPVQRQTGAKKRGKKED